MTRICSVEGCEKPHLARGWCGMHYMRWRTHGDIENDGGLDHSGTSYVVLHKRLTDERGGASEYPCIACGESAHHWAWQHTGPSRTGTASNGYPIAWGTDLDTYAPMCRKCHTILDGPGTFETFPCGHPRKGKWCQPCANERTRRWRARRSVT